MREYILLTIFILLMAMVIYCPIRSETKHYRCENCLKLLNEEKKAVMGLPMPKSILDLSSGPELGILDGLSSSLRCDYRLSYKDIFHKDCEHSWVLIATSLFWSKFWDMRHGHSWLVAPSLRIIVLEVMYRIYHDFNYPFKITFWVLNMLFPQEGLKKTEIY